MATSEEKLKMLTDDFNKLQKQLIDIRTENYEIGNKLRKTENENKEVRDKCSNQEKELQRMGKIMKFPGFNAITKSSKSKKDLNELVEENERLNEQMQRHEDDFKLQNQTFQEELSRLEKENRALQEQLQGVKCNGQNNTEENNDNLSRTPPPENGVSWGDIPKGLDTHSLLDKLQERLLLELPVLIESTCGKPSEIDGGGDDNHSSDGETRTEPNLQNGAKGLFDVSDILQIYFNELRDTLDSSTIHAGENAQSESNVSGAQDQQLRDLTAQLESLKRTNLDLTAQLDSQKKNNNDLTGQLNIQKKTCNDLSLHLDAQKKMNSSLTTQCDVQKKTIEDLNVQLSPLRKTNEELNKDLGTWELKLTIISQDFERTIQELKNEVNVKEKESEKNIELAEKRKCLLDKFALDQQQTIEVHQKKLEEVKDRHNTEMEQLVGQKNLEVEDLKKNILNQKKTRKELEDSGSKLKKENEEMSTENASIKEEIASLDKKCGWLERTLKEEQEKCEQQSRDHEAQVSGMTENFEKEKDELGKAHLAQVQGFEDAMKTAEVIQQESEGLTEKLKQASKDHEIELTIIKKKHDQMNKDLKRQLVSERKRADQLSQKLQDLIQEIKAKQTYEEIFNPEVLQMKVASSHRRQDSGSHMSTVSSVNENDMEINRSIKTSSPVGSTSNLSLSMTHNISGLSDETMDLISRYADLQQEKWALEEKVRHLEENGAVMADDLMQKSLIIQHYVMEKRTDTPLLNKKNLTLKEKMMDKIKQLGEENLNREMNVKMQKILEETLATNVQLQKDLDRISLECDKLKNPPKS